MNTPPQQLEFDLVSPLLAEPTLEQLEAARKKLRMPQPKTAAEFGELWDLAGRLNHVELAFDSQPAAPEQLLSEIRVFIPPADWKKDLRLWSRRARKNPRRLAKVILVLKKIWNLT